LLTYTYCYGSEEVAPYFCLYIFIAMSNTFGSKMRWDLLFFSVIIITFCDMLHGVDICLNTFFPICLYCKMKMNHQVQTTSHQCLHSFKTKKKVTHSFILKLEGELYVLAKHHKMCKLANWFHPSNILLTCLWSCYRRASQITEYTHTGRVKHLITLLVSQEENAWYMPNVASYCRVLCPSQEKLLFWLAHSMMA
jgi:hypothetical protein